MGISQAGIFLLTGIAFLVLVVVLKKHRLAEPDVTVSSQEHN